jgi:hypothetical protein
MKRIILFIAIFGCAIRSWAIDISDAVHQNEVTLTVESTESYSGARALLHNNTGQVLDLDFSRTGFVSIGSEAQRIGIARIQGGNSAEVLLMPYGSAFIDLETRCLDHTRPAPNNGDTYEMLPNRLPDSIVSALRRNADQQEVWNITNAGVGDPGFDDAIQWKIFDQRNFPNTNLHLSGNWSYSTNWEGATTEIKGNGITNTNSDGYSGILMLKLGYYTSENLAKYFETRGLGGCEIAESKIDEHLNGGCRYSGIDETVPVLGHPDPGKYWAVLSLQEYSHGKYYIKATMVFDHRVTVSQ